VPVFGDTGTGTCILTEVIARAQARSRARNTAV